MNLYILEPILKTKINPWVPWYDKAFGFVVRAASEKAARKIADEHAGDENRPVNQDGDYDYTSGEIEHPWLSTKTSTCEILTVKGDEGLIMKDFASA